MGRWKKIRAFLGPLRGTWTTGREPLLLSIPIIFSPSSLRGFSLIVQKPIFFLRQVTKPSSGLRRCNLPFNFRPSSRRVLRVPISFTDFPGPRIKNRSSDLFPNHFFFFFCQKSSTNLLGLTHAYVQVGLILVACRLILSLPQTATTS